MIDKNPINRPKIDEIISFCVDSRNLTFLAILKKATDSVMNPENESPDEEGINVCNYATNLIIYLNF